MVIHVVQRGESLYSIALDYGVSMSQISIDNGLEAPERLVPGQALVIRFPEAIHTVLPGETLASIAREVLRQDGRFQEIIEAKAGCTIFCHCGPGTLGVIFLRKA